METNEIESNRMGSSARESNGMESVDVASNRMESNGMASNDMVGRVWVDYELNTVCISYIFLLYLMQYWATRICSLLGLSWPVLLCVLLEV